MKFPETVHTSVISLVFLAVFLTLPFYFAKQQYTAQGEYKESVAEGQGADKAQDDRAVPTASGDKNGGELKEMPLSVSPVYTSQQEEIVAYIRQVFGKDADDALKIVGCENHAMIPDRVGYNSDGSIDVGIFQINSSHGINPAYLKDWHINVDVAYKIFKDSKWNPWVCYWKWGALDK